jgi:hypothetical protein
MYMPCQGGYEVAFIGAVMGKDVGDEIAAGKMVRGCERQTELRGVRW